MLSAIKWTATFILVTGSFINSLGYYPLGPLVLLVGGAVWLWISIQMKDRPLIATNAAMMVAGGVPLLINLVT